MKALVKNSFVSTLPVMAGYVFLGTGFGMLMHAKGYGVLWAAAMRDFHSAKLIAVIALVTAALRFLPFWIFSGKRQTPAYISFSAAPFGILEILSSAVVIVLHLLKRNTLLSIAGGTVFYMLLVQIVF